MLIPVERKNELVIAEICINNKYPIENNISSIFDVLLKKISFPDSIRILKNINNPYIETNDSIIFQSNGSRIIQTSLCRREEILTGGSILKSGSEVTIRISNPSTREFIIKEILEKFSITGPQKIINYLKHHFTTHLADTKKSDSGKYYTPRHLVDLIFQMVSPYIREDSIVLDPACGCGAFLDEKKFPRLMGTDMDSDAVEVLKILGFENVFADNSLLNVGREKYNINESHHLVIIGNPPYNDVTSKNKKIGKNAKRKTEIIADADIYSNDLGMCFLKAFDKLKADVICILHPLAYLIKKTNFKKLGDFTSNYILKKGVIFSSHEFSDTQQTPFPILAALYVRGNMDYSYILNFQFDILNDERKFVLGHIETIDGYVRKYPPNKSEEKKSDIGLYMYNIRDTNSLLTSGNLSEKENHGSHITINYNDLYKYSYLNCMKRYFDKDFLFGNLSPVVDAQAIEKDDYLKDLFIIDTMIRNRRLSVFNVDNPESILYTKNLLRIYGEKAIRFKESGRKEPDIYSAILDFAEHGETNTEKIEGYIRDYFVSLKKIAFKQ